MAFKDKEKVKLYAKKYREEHKEYFSRKWREWREKNRIKNTNQRVILSPEERITARREYMNKYSRNNRKKIKARREVFKNLRSKKIKRLSCKECGFEKTEAHHEDYSNPLDIIWLCKKHHVEADKALKARNKLSTVL